MPSLCISLPSLLHPVHTLIVLRCPAQSPMIAVTTVYLYLYSDVPRRAP